MNIWVFAQESNGAPTTGTLELLTKARSLGAPTAFVGGDASAIAGALGEHGASKIYATGDLGGKLPGVAVSAAMKAVIDGGDSPDLIMFPQNYEGRDIMARLSVKLDRTVLTNNIDITAEGDKVSVTTPVFGGNVLVTTRSPRTARTSPRSARRASPPSPQVAALRMWWPRPVPDLGSVGAASIVAVHVEESSGPKLDEANIVVSGGRGLTEASKYEMIEQLAKLLKGAPGASRAIVDAGWVPYSYQVGQTGKVVKPGVYIACGISGATQHMVGMKGRQEHHRDQQGQRGPDLRDRRPRHRRRRAQGAPETDRGPAVPLDHTMGQG
jgi:electron transfer flavoprotein alpha subunit